MLLGAASATALATGVGAIPVFFLGSGARALRPFLWGLASGVMGVAAIAGLLMPALDEGTTAQVLGGLIGGLVFLAVARRGLQSADPHVAGLHGADLRTAILTFGVLSVHSLPEGLAIGTAYASETAGLGLFVIVAIAIQNVPEGTSVSIPMSEAGFGRAWLFWGAVLTSAPQPAGALAAYALVEEVDALLPVSFAFAGGAMLALVAIEMLPTAVRGGRLSAALGILGGAGAMLAFSLALGV